MPCLPPPRGPLSEMLLAELVHAPHTLPPTPLGPGLDELADEDLQLSLYVCYELHYRGLPGVADEWEWDPSLLSLRSRLEGAFERALRQAVPVGRDDVEPGEIDLALRSVEENEAPSLSSYIRAYATLAQVRELMIHRSAYQLKEADPHAWAIPRLWGSPKAALIEIELDEYGRGRLDWMHAELFARAMRAVGLDSRYGAYLDQIPGCTLATVNLMSMFGLHRRWRGATVGHLALFEMTSSIPNRRYAEGLRRLGCDGDATLFFDEHVTADAVHENIAAVDLAGGLARQDPDLVTDILWGARTLAHLDARWTEHMLGAWQREESSLLPTAVGALAI